MPQEIFVIKLDGRTLPLKVCLFEFLETGNVEVVMSVTG